MDKRASHWGSATQLPKPVRRMPRQRRHFLLIFGTMDMEESGEGKHLRLLSIVAASLLSQAWSAIFHFLRCLYCLSICVSVSRISPMRLYPLPFPSSHERIVGSHYR